MAALLNGSLAQALEMDDKHGSSLARPGSTVTPAVLAVAQANNMSLTEVVTAVTVGYEVMIRLGFVAGDRFLERGYHTSSLLGAFGTVAAVGSAAEIQRRGHRQRARHRRHVCRRHPGSHAHRLDLEDPAWRLGRA